MKKSKLISIISIPLIIIIFVAVFIIPGLFGRHSGAIVSAGASDLMKGVSGNVTAAADSKLPDKFTESFNGFSIDLFKNTVKPGKNLFISPVSIYFAAGLTANGAAGDTEAAFNSVMGKYGLTKDQINNASKMLLDEYNNLNGTTKFKLANSIWYRDDFKPEKAFLQENADHFGAGLYKENFADKKTPALISKWIETNTGGYIKNGIDTIDKDTVMYLIDAFYFEAKWEMPFKIDNAKKYRTFYTDVAQVETVFMQIDDNVSCINTHNEIGVVLPYKDGKFAFMALMPNDGSKISDYVQKFDDKTITGLLDSRKKAKILLSMPKFKIEYSGSLDEALKEMGLGVAFDENKADFSKMGYCPIKGNIYIGRMDHKTYIDFDEEGTKAGGASIFGMAAKSAPQIPKEIVFDKPFVYAIIDLKTHMPVFMGTLADPTAN